jgi:membrane-bound ClpP family serine protease
VYLYIAILILLGITLLVLEILILPGLVAGIIGGIFLLVAIAWTFQGYGTEAGIYTGIATCLITAAALYIALKTRVWSRFSLKEDLQQSRMNVIAPDTIAEGTEALTVSALRPMGTVMIGDLKLEARTNGEFIPENRKVIITRVHSYGVVVKESPVQH